MPKVLPYTEEMGTLICERIADGESLRAICSDESMPSRTTVRNWLIENGVFASQYARAREEQAEAFAAQIVEIADDEATPADSRRIKVDARKWIASKLRPRVYGDRTTTELTGAVVVKLSPSDADL